VGFEPCLGCRVVAAWRTTHLDTPHPYLRQALS
jgi:hypothetical protein